MKTKLLFIDRDGTLIAEPSNDFQVDSLEKLSFIPGVVSALKRIADRQEYRLVMATNQDGLGTDSFPEAAFLPPHTKMLELFSGEGIVFDDVLIDTSFAHAPSPNRKPGTGMFGKYLSEAYDLPNSYVIGDRITDVELAKNLGAKAILFRQAGEGREQLARAGLLESCALITDSWAEIALFLDRENRTALVRRKTRETDITLRVDLDGRMESSIDTGLHFLNHMLEQIVVHAGVGIELRCAGDLHVDEHHTVEDIAIAFGTAVYKALGAKLGIERYGFALPMDEAEACVLLDFGGRIDFIWEVEFRRERIGDVPTEMFRHFFKSFAQAACCNLHISAKGENEHHKAEAIFKAFARALKAAAGRQPFSYTLPSSKGIL